MLHAASRKLFSGRSRRDESHRGSSPSRGPANPPTSSQSASACRPSVTPKHSRLPRKRLPFGRDSTFTAPTSVPRQETNSTGPSASRTQLGLTPASPIGSLPLGGDVITLPSKMEVFPSEANSQAPVCPGGLNSKSCSPLGGDECQPMSETLHRDTRRISASFGADGPLSSNPTTASSTVTAPTLVRSDNTYDQSVRILRESAVRSTRRPSNKSYENAGSSGSSTTTSGTLSTTALIQDENTPPRHMTSSRNKSFFPRIPRSKTFNALSSLTPSLNRDAAKGSDYKMPGSDDTASKPSSLLQGDGADTGTSHASFVVESPRISLISASSRPIRPSISENIQTASASSIRLVMDAMPSGYWAGRFQSLHDRFRSELLMPENLNILVAAQTGLKNINDEPKGQRSTLSNLRLSESTPMLPGLDEPPAQSSIGGNKRGRGRLDSISEVNPEVSSTRKVSMPLPPLPQFETARGLVEAAGRIFDDDNRCRRVFIHLKAMCQTLEANSSLLAWQIRYARLERREKLLPGGIPWSGAKNWDWEHRNDKTLVDIGYKYDRKEWDKIRRELKLADLQPRPEAHLFPSWARPSI